MDSVHSKMKTKHTKAQETDDVRGGRRVKYMPWILGLSTITATLVLFFIFAGFAT